MLTVQMLKIEYSDPSIIHTTENSAESIPGVSKHLPGGTGADCEGGPIAGDSDGAAASLLGSGGGEDVDWATSEAGTVGAGTTEAGGLCTGAGLGSEVAEEATVGIGATTGAWVILVETATGAELEAWLGA